MYIEGFRQTSFKSKYENLADEKMMDFASRGEDTKMVKKGSYYYIFVRIQKELGTNENFEVVETVENKKKSSKDLGDSVDAGEEI